MAATIVAMPRAFQTVDGAFPECEALRASFDERFADPRQARGDRFVWDLWHVPGQYTALRTPAWTYFPEAGYRALHEGLVRWGRKHLGCHDISPPWLSCYVEGCEQRLHGDLPHGPWAFVLSLTRWKGRVFSGGETLLLRDEVLSYWSDFTSTRSIEEGEVLHTIEPRFGRLTVFDPRIPHGVRRVAGTMDPREGRLVVHGWFVQPRPFIEGPLPVRKLEQRLEALGDVVARALEDGLPIAGMVAFGLDVTIDGNVGRVRVLSDTTRVPDGEETARRRVLSQLKRWLAQSTFGKQRAPSTITLPIVFEASNED